MNQGGTTENMTGQPAQTHGTYPMWHEHEDRFRSDWQNRFGSNKSWGEHHGAFRYGWEAGFNSQFKGKQFTDVESDLGRDWSNRYNRWGDSHKGNRVEQAWNDFKDTVREGWDKARSEFHNRF